MLTVYSISFRTSLCGVRLSRMKRLLVAGKGPLPESASMMLGFEKGLRVFQAEEDATIVVCPLSNSALRPARVISSSDI